MIRQNLQHKFKIYKIFKPHISDRYKFTDKFKLPYLLGKSDFIFVDDYHPTVNKVKFRKTQEIIQVWHAVGAFKTIGYSRIGKKGGPFLIQLDIGIIPKFMFLLVLLYQCMLKRLVLMKVRL